MPTTRLSGSVRATLTTGSEIWWSAQWSCADLAEAFFYWFKNDGTLYKAQLPNLSGQATVTTVPNYGGMQAMRAHPTNSSLLVYFNSTDGVNTINTSTGAIVQLMTQSAFDAVLAAESDLTIAYITDVRIRGTKLLIHGKNDPSGAVWEYDPSNNALVRLFSNEALSKAFDLGPDTTKELVLSGYDTPSLIFYIFDLSLGQARMLAGVGTAASMVDGDAYKVADFAAIEGLYRMANDLYYVRDTNDYTRWVQGGLVGSYSDWTLGGRFICQALPIRNMIVSVGVRDVTVWN